MTLQEIKKAVIDGNKVCWSNDNYQVVSYELNEWLILSKINNHAIGLTHKDGITLNGKESEFCIV